MKTLKLLLASITLGITLVSCSNDDENQVVETPQIEISTGSSTKGLFINNNYLTKVKYNSGAFEIFEYNSSDKLEKVSFYNSNGSILYYVDLFYNSSNELDYTIKNTTGNINYRKSSLTYNSATNISIEHENINSSTNNVTPVFTSEINYNINNNITYYSSFGNVSSYSFLTSNSLYSSFLSLKELSFYYRELALFRGTVSENNLDIEDAPGLEYDCYYEYDFNSNNKVSSIRKYSNNTDELLETSDIIYN